ncbi:nucleotide sugar dehydrogenase [Lachnospiraceae bacterium 48-21]
MKDTMRNYDNIKIAVVGMGYVGLSLAIMLAQHHEVLAVDIDSEKVELINKKCSPLKDEYVEKYLKETELHILATTDSKNAYNEADYVVIAVPTNFNVEINAFDTSILETVVEDVHTTNPKAIIVIKSTIPIGFTKQLKEKYTIESLIFCPEFLRETKALYDCLYPSRIVVSKPEAQQDIEMETFASLLVQGIHKKHVSVMYMDSSEAEAVKLFSNAYLAMRISFFNELDTYAESNGLRTKMIIDGVCSDERIGNWYNNPSFGYGGYCLPKDSKQLRSCFGGIPQRMISAIIESNEIRKRYIGQQIVNKVNSLKEDYLDKTVIVGIYRLTMKYESDNFRDSSIYDVITELQMQDIKIVVYEPLLNSTNAYYDVINELTDFIEITDIIVANRLDEELKNVSDKVISRDIFFRD